MADIIKKDEKYYKEVLAKVFEGNGNFQQFEFTSFGGSLRPDFVILDKDSFTYFEIKTEYDTFDRLTSQFNGALGLFTHRFLVIPESKLEEYIKYDIGRIGDCGVYILEDLEKGNKSPRIKQNQKGWVLIDKVCEVLWRDELFHYINLVNPDAWCIDYDGKKKTLKYLDVMKLQIFFKLYYSNKDSLKILNEVLPQRTYNLRTQRQERLLNLGDKSNSSQG